MILELTVKQQALLTDALQTRLQRIQQMIKLFEEDGTSRGDSMAEVYSQEFLDVECLLQTILRASLV